MNECNTLMNCSVISKRGQIQFLWYAICANIVYDQLMLNTASDYSPTAESPKSMCVYLLANTIISSGDEGEENELSASIIATWTVDSLVGLAWSAHKTRHPVGFFVSCSGCSHIETFD